MVNYSNILIVSGSGRKSGKTTFSCSLINYFSKNNKIAAIKVSPHFHNEKTDNPVLINSSDYIIEEEINVERDKDSSRMLKAGAEHVFYVQAKDEFLPEVIQFILKKTGKGFPVICESGAAANFIKPGLHVFMDKEDSLKNQEFKKKADLILALSDVFKVDMSQFQFINGKWKKL